MNFKEESTVYENIGGKIKTLAKAIFFVEALASIIAGIVVIVETEEAWGLLIILGGCIIGWVSSWIVYGFGEIIDKLTEIAYNTSNGKKKNNKVKPKKEDDLFGEEEKANSENNEEEEESDDDEVLSIPQRVCPRCGDKHDFDYPQCPKCNLKYL